MNGETKRMHWTRDNTRKRSTSRADKYTTDRGEQKDKGGEGFRDGTENELERRADRNIAYEGYRIDGEGAGTKESASKAWVASRRLCHQTG